MSQQEGTTPPRDSQGNLEGDRLESWKEIASYLRRDVRTVQRWERRENLPVHRHVHDKLATVYAYRAEIDAWWKSGRERLEAEQSAEQARSTALGNGAATSVDSLDAV